MSLFGNKAEKKEEVQYSDDKNIIGKGTTIKGDIETYGNIRIDGKLTGDIRSKSKVILGNGSVVDGNIFSQNAEIFGEITGMLEIADTLILHPTAVVNGDINTGKLIVAAGARFNGACHMGEQKNGQLNGKNGLKVERKEQAKVSA